jgi:FtsH-binding integral membrane protein
MTAGTGVRAILYAIAALALNVVISVLWILVYSLAIDPGQDAAYYERYALGAVPVVAIVAGVPLLFGFGWLIAREKAGQGALVAAGAVGVAYCIVDVLILLLTAGEGTIPLGMIAVSYLTKIVAAVAGGAVAGRRGALETPENDPI